MHCICALTIFFVLGFLGCRSVIDHTPKGLVLESGRITNFRPGLPVGLVNAQPLTNKAPIETRGIVVTADYNYYTAVLIDLLRTEIEKSAGSVSPIATKQLRLAVINVGLILSLVDYFCTVDGTVELGEGRIYGFTSQSTGSATAAIDKALVNLAVSILNDPRVRSFLEH